MNIDNTIQDPREQGVQGLSGLEGLNTLGLSDRHLQSLLHSQVIRNNYKAIKLDRILNTPDIQPIKGIEGFGNSKYDREVHNISDLYNLNNFRGELQSGFLQILNGTLKGAVLAGTTFADGTVGLLFGVTDMFANVSNKNETGWETFSRLWNNEFSNAMTQINEELESILPNYETDEEASREWYKNLGTQNFWGNFIKNMGFTVGAAFSGAAWSKAFRIIPAFKNSALANLVLGSFMSAVNEGRIEANHNSTDFYKIQLLQYMQVFNSKLEELNRMYQSGQLSLAEYNQSLIELDNKKQAIEKDLLERKAKMGAVDFLANTALLWGSNFHTFKHLYSQGLKGATINNASKLITKDAAGKYVANPTGIMGSVGKALKTGVIEGNEEMAQKLAGSYAAYKYTYDSPDAYLKAFNDPLALLETNDFMKAFSLGWKDSYGNEEAYEEFAMGFLTGILGIPTFGKSANNTDLTWLGKKKSFGLTGGIIGLIVEDRLNNKEALEAVNFMNDYMQKTLNTKKSFAARQYFSNIMDGYNSENNIFEFKNAEDNEEFLAIETFAKADRLQDFFDIIDKDFDNLTDDLLEVIATSMNLRDTAGNLLTSTEEGKAKLIKQLNKNKEKLKNHALEYNRLVNDFSGLEREKDLSRELVDELAWLQWKINRFRERSFDILETSKPALLKAIENLNAAIELELDTVKKAQLKAKRGNIELLSKGFFRFKNLQKNPQIIDTIKETLKDEDIALKELAKNLEDLSKITVLEQQFLDTLNKYLENPSKMKKKAEEIELSSEELFIQELDDNITNEWNSIQTKELFELFKLKYPKIDYKKLKNKSKDSTASALYELDEYKLLLLKINNESSYSSEEIKNEIKELLESIATNTDNIDLFKKNISNFIAKWKNDTLLGWEKGQSDEIILALENLIREELNVTGETNDLSYNEEGVEDIEEILAEAANFINNEQKIEVVNDGIELLEPINSAGPVVSNSTEEKKTTEQEELEKELNNKIDSNYSDNNTQADNTPTPINNSTETTSSTIFKSTTTEYPIYKDRWSWVNGVLLKFNTVKNLFDFIKNRVLLLANSGAYDYVNNGNLYKGQKVYFIIDNTNESIDNYKGKKSPIIYVVIKLSDGTYLKIGDLPSIFDSATLDKLPNTKILIDEIYNEYNHSSKEGIFVFSKNSEISKVYHGVIPYTKEHNSVKDVTSNPEFLIVNNSGTFHKPTTGIRLPLSRLKAGLIFITLNDASGKVVVLAHSKKLGEILDTTEYGKLILLLFNNVINASSYGEFIAAKKELFKYVYAPNLAFVAYDSEGNKYTNSSTGSPASFIIYEKRKDKLHKVVSFNKSNGLNTFKTIIQNLNANLHIKYLTNHDYVKLLSEVFTVSLPKDTTHTINGFFEMVPYDSTHKVFKDVLLEIQNTVPIVETPTETNLDDLLDVSSYKDSIVTKDMIIEDLIKKGLTQQLAELVYENKKDLLNTIESTNSKLNSAQDDLSDFDRNINDSVNLTPINLEQEYNWLQKVLPLLATTQKLKLVENLKSKSGNFVWGKFKQGVIYIAENAVRGTLYHEAFHAVTSMLLSNEEKLLLYNEAKNIHGNKSNLELEELLAEDFRKYVQLEELPIIGTIVKIFRTLKNSINILANNLSSIDLLFYNINRGKYASPNILELLYYTDIKNYYKNKYNYDNLSKENLSLIDLKFSKNIYDSFSLEEKEMALYCI